MEGGTVEFDGDPQLRDRGVEVDGAERQDHRVLLDRPRHPGGAQQVAHAPDLELALAARGHQSDELPQCRPARQRRTAALLGRHLRGRVPCTAASAGAPRVRPLREDDDTGTGPQQPARGHPRADAVPVDHPSEVGGPGDAVRSEQGDEVVGHDGQGAHRPPERNPGRPRRQRAAGTWVAGASRGCSVAGPRTDQARRAV